MQRHYLAIAKIGKQLAVVLALAVALALAVVLAIEVVLTVV